MKKGGKVHAILAENDIPEVGRSTEIQKANSGAVISNQNWYLVNAAALTPGRRYELWAYTPLGEDLCVLTWATGRTSSVPTDATGRALYLHNPIVVTPTDDQSFLFVKAIQNPSGLTDGGYLAQVAPTE